MYCRTCQESGQMAIYKDLEFKMESHRRHKFKSLELYLEEDMAQEIKTKIKSLQDVKQHAINSIDELA